MITFQLAVVAFAMCYIASYNFAPVLAVINDRKLEGHDRT